MKPQEYAIYNRDEMKCQHPIGQIRIADDNTGAYCRKCCDWISVTDVANSAELSTLRAQNAELIANIEATLYAIEPNRGDLSQNQRQSLDNLRAILAKYGDDNATI